METYIIYLLGALAAVVFFQAGKHYGQNREYKSWMHTVQHAYVSQEYIAYLCSHLSNREIAKALKMALINKTPIADLNKTIEIIANPQYLQHYEAPDKPERYQVRGPNQHGMWQVWDSVAKMTVANRGTKAQAAANAYARNSEEFKNG